MIITKEDYLRSYKDAEFVRLISDLWMRERLVAIGFGFSDQFLVGLAETTLRTRPGEERHFAFIGSKQPIPTYQSQMFISKYKLNPIFYLISDVKQTDGST